MPGTYTVNLNTVFDNLHRNLTGRDLLPTQQAKQQILLACMPKSGSTFLKTILINLFTMEEIPLASGYDRREQELSLEKLLLLRDCNYVAQLHIRHSRPTQKLINQFGLRPIILVRDLFDCAISNRDHFFKFKQFESSMCYVDETILNVPKTRVDDFVIDHLMPWCVNFYVGWFKAGNASMMTYEALNTDPVNCIAGICTQIGITANLDDIAAAVAVAQQSNTLKNSARIGRGHEELTPTQQERIHRLCGYYPDVDFTLVGV